MKNVVRNVLNGSIWLVLLSSTLLYASSSLTQILDHNLGTNAPDPGNISVNSNGTFFIANNAFNGIGMGGTGNIVGWTLTSGGVLTQFPDYAIGTNTAKPNIIVGNSQGDFFIVNGDTIGMGGTSNIVGWLLPAGGALTEIIDPHLGSQQGNPSTIAVNSNGDFLIANSTYLTMGGNNIVGWMLNSSGALTQFVDPHIQANFTAHPYSISVNSKDDFFVVNTALSSGPVANTNIIGWIISAAGVLTQIQDLALPPNSSATVQPLQVAVNSNGDFCIGNNYIFGKNEPSNIVGWTVTSAGVVTEIVDNKLTTMTGMVGNISATSSGDFFVTNQTNLGASFTDIVCWKVTTGNPTPLQIKDTHLGTNSPLPVNISGNSNGVFFITNNTYIGTGGMGNIVGWTLTSAGALTQIVDTGLGKNEAFPGNIAVNSNGSFFITNSSPIGTGGKGNIVGWMLTPGSTTPVEIKDLNLGANKAAPSTISVNSNGDFFVVNDFLIGTGGSGNIVGWTVTSAGALTQIADPSLGTHLAEPSQIAVNGNGLFCISNSPATNIGGTNGDIVGWTFGTFSLSSPTAPQGFSKKDKGLGQIDYYNLIQWSPPPGPAPAGYQIFRNSALTDLVATLPNNVLSYLDHNRKVGVTYSYYIVAVGSGGAISPPVEVQVLVRK